MQEGGCGWNGWVAAATEHQSIAVPCRADRLAEESPSQGGAISGRLNGAMGDLCPTVDDSESDHVF
jgi:hypothetical protein